MDTQSDLPNINLNNFEDDRFTESKYVLTSPRSLQACGAFGIKPAELLYRPLSEFQDDLIQQGYGLRQVYDEYDDHEIKRREKLTKCRTLRDTIIRDELFKLLPASSGPPIDDGYRSANSSRDVSPDRTRTIFGRYTDLADNCTTQRERTQQSIMDSIEPKVGMSPIRSNTPPHNDNNNYYNNLSDSEVQNKKKSNKTKRRRTKSASGGLSAGSSASWRSSGTDLADQMSRSLNLTDLKSLKSSMKRGRQIQNPALRKSLGYNTARIKPEDEKILEALHRKHEQQRQNDIRREQARIEWEEEKQRTEREKDLNESFRRQKLAHSIADSEEFNTDLRRRRADRDEAVRRSMLEKCEQSDHKWRRSHEKQQRRKSMELDDKRRRFHERKKSQEMKRAWCEDKQRESIQSELERSEDKAQRASMNKNNLVMTQQLSRQRANMRDKDQHDTRYNEMSRNYETFTEDLKRSIEGKELKYRLNQDQFNKTRDHQLRMSSKEREQKFHRSKEKLKHMDYELDDWQQTLKTKRQALDTNAHLASASIVENRAVRAAADRAEREKRQRDTYNRIQDVAEDQREQQKGMIATKNMRVKLVTEQKQRVVDQVRELSATSQRMREDVRKKMGRDSFDRKALDVQLQSRVGEGHRSATKNRSSTHLIS